MEPGTSGPLVEAGRLLEAGDFDGAIRACQRCLRTMPDSFPAHLKLAQIYGRKAQDTRDAVVRRLVEREFGEAMRLAPPDENSHNALFDLAVETGQIEALRARYRGPWAALPFSGMALRRLDDAGPVVRTVPDHSGDPLRKVMIGAVILIVASLAWQFGPRIWGGVQGSMGPVTDPAAPFTLDDLSGTKVSLSDFTGKAVVVVDFWATWCGPCRASLPGLHALRKKYHGQGVEVLNINLAENPDTIKNFLNSEQLDLWVLLDTNNAIARAYGVSGIPCVFIIDKRGSIREKIVGYSPENEARIETLVSSLK